MLITETIIINNHEYTHNYSDAGFYIERDEILYADAIDPLNMGRVYTETDIPIEEDEVENEDAAYAEAGRIMMGVDE